jgi:hypothetical protein
METVQIRDGKKSDPGSGINIQDPQHWIYLHITECVHLEDRIKKGGTSVVEPKQFFRSGFRLWLVTVSSF